VLQQLHTASLAYHKKKQGCFFEIVWF